MAAEPGDKRTLSLIDAAAAPSAPTGSGPPVLGAAMQRYGLWRRSMISSWKLHLTLRTVHGRQRMSLVKPPHLCFLERDGRQSVSIKREHADEGAKRTCVCIARMHGPSGLPATSPRLVGTMLEKASACIQRPLVMGSYVLCVGSSSLKSLTVPRWEGG